MMESEEAFPIPGIPDFWERVRRAPRKHLALDYDGTLAPFRVERMRAVPLDGVIDCLASISRRPDTILVIISGRPVDEILDLVGDIGLTVVGSHGWEVRAADGSRCGMTPSAAQERRLRRAEREVRKRGLESRAERKVASLAVHTRGLSGGTAEEIESELVRLWEADAPRAGLAPRRFDGGVELRAAGIDKGTILDDLLRDEPEDTFCVYVGDDETDEDAFRALQGLGVTFCVGAAERATLASRRLPNVDAVETLLRWVASRSPVG